MYIHFHQFNCRIDGTKYNRSDLFFGWGPMCLPLHTESSAWHIDVKTSYSLWSRSRFYYPHDSITGLWFSIYPIPSDRKVNWPECLFVDFNVSYFYDQIHQTKEAHSLRRTLSTRLESINFFYDHLNTSVNSSFYEFYRTKLKLTQPMVMDELALYWMRCCDFNDTARAIDREKEN